MLLLYWINNYDIPTFLLIILFLPLVYLNNGFHYDFPLIIISSVPVYLFVVLALFKFVHLEQDWQISITYLQLPVVLMVIYFIISGIMAVQNSGDINWVAYQVFLISLYLMIFPIMYLIRRTEQYKIIFLFLLIVVIFSSFEYLLFNIIGSMGRFVTFQSGFFPIAIGVLLAYTLYSKKLPEKLLGIAILVTIIAGTFITLTRSLWATTFLVVIFVFLFYIISQRHVTLTKLLLLLFVIVLPFLLLRDTGNRIDESTSQSKIVKYRTQSVTDPLEDSSFLMRVEFAMYSIERFLDSPFIGQGLGDYLKYKIFLESNKPNYYMDSTWLYLLWKGGIIGFVLFAWMYFRFFKVTFHNLMNTEDTNVKIINLGLLAGLLGLSILGVLSPLLIKYKTNALLAFIFAYVETERLKMMKHET